MPRRLPARRHRSTRTPRPTLDAALAVIRASGLAYKMNPMSTVIEGPSERIGPRVSDLVGKFRRCGVAALQPQGGARCARPDCGRREAIVAMQRVALTWRVVLRRTACGRPQTTRSGSSSWKIWRREADIRPVEQEVVASDPSARFALSNSPPAS
ncbi:MAG: hypothetical protein EKK53_17740 [Burkholderiales bacterium]|nr:MAG: hypothetical protein EKK53_17740 [Burkholderiales bacterium]